jgi:hypothetical protein
MPRPIFIFCNSLESRNPEISTIGIEFAMNDREIPHIILISMP